MSAARKKLDDGWVEYEVSAAEIAAGKIMLTDARMALDQKQAEYNAVIAAAEADTNMTVEQIASVLPVMATQLDEAKSLYNTLYQLSELRNMRDAFDSDTEEYAALNQQYQTALANAGISEAEADYLFAGLGQMKMDIDAAQAQYDQLATLVAVGETGMGGI